MKNSQCSTSTLTCGCSVEVAKNDGKTVRAEVKPSGQLNCDETSLPEIEKLASKVDHVDVHAPKSGTTEEHCNNGQVHQCAKIKLS